MTRAVLLLPLMFLAVSTVSFVSLIAVDASVSSSSNSGAVKRTPPDNSDSVPAGAKDSSGETASPDAGAAFSSIPEISVLTVQEKAAPAWHLFVILLRGVGRNALFEELGHRGVKANVHYIPIYHFDYYQTLGFCPTDFPNTEKAFKNILTLPLYADISGEEVAHVIGAVKESIKKLAKK